jgi:hypothetical protein
VQLFYEDGTRISANSDINVFAEEIGRKTTDSAEKKKTFKEKPFYITLQKSSS